MTSLTLKGFQVVPVEPNQYQWILHIEGKERGRKQEKIGANKEHSKGRRGTKMLNT